MGGEAKLHADPTVIEPAGPGEGDPAPDPFEPLGRLATEAELVERLLSHIAEQRDRARAERERLEQSRAGMEEADRASSQVLIAARAAAIASRLTRLRVAASLAESVVRLRASEAESLEGEATHSDARGAAPDRDVPRTRARHPTEGVRRAS